MFYFNQFLYDINYGRKANGDPCLEYPRDKMLIVDMVLDGISGHRAIFFRHVLNDMSNLECAHRAP